MIPGLGRAPGGESGNPIQHCCSGNPMDRGAWQATVHGVTKSQDTTEKLTLSLFSKLKLKNKYPSMGGKKISLQTRVWFWFLLFTRKLGVLGKKSKSMSWNRSASILDIKQQAERDSHPLPPPPSPLEVTPLRIGQSRNEFLKTFFFCY